jgi:hypothetical protein
MDGVASNKGVVVLAATNRPDLIDSAVLRPGRFDRRINLEIPDLTGRIGILKVHARNKVLAGNVDLEVVARRTTGMSGADLENLLNEAAIRGTKRAALAITMDDIDGAYFDVLLGRVRNGAILRDDDRRAIAVGLDTPSAATVRRQRPRRHRAAVARSAVLSISKTASWSAVATMSDIVVCLAGRAAGEGVPPLASTGAEDDFKQASSLARVTSLWSMGTWAPVLQSRPSSPVARESGRAGAEHHRRCRTQALEIWTATERSCGTGRCAAGARDHRGCGDRGDRAHACGFAATVAADPRRRVATRRSKLPVEGWRDVGRRRAVAARRFGERGVRQAAMHTMFQDQ